jgi:DNA repair exonuclease SbcCD ATPase subunit
MPFALRACAVHVLAGNVLLSLLALPRGAVSAEHVEIHTKDGRVLRGIITAEDERRVVLETRIASRTRDLVVQLPLALDQILTRQRIAAPEEEYERRKATVGDAPDAQLALAGWCRDSGLADQAVVHATRAWELEHGHAKAVELLHALGRYEHAGRWLTEADYLAATGTVRYKDRFVSPEEAEAAKRAEASAEDAREAASAVETAKHRQARAEQALKDLAEQEAQLRKQLADAQATLGAVSADIAAYTSARAQEDALQEAAANERRDQGAATPATMQRLGEAQTRTAKAKRAHDRAQREQVTAKARTDAATRKLEALAEKRTTLQADGEKAAAGVRAAEAEAAAAATVPGEPTPAAR